MNIAATISKSNELLRHGAALRAAVATDFGYGDTDVQRRGKPTLRATVVGRCGDVVAIRVATVNGYVRRVVDVDSIGAVRKERQG